MTGRSHSPSLSNSILVLSARDVETLTASFSSQDLQDLMAHVFYALALSWARSPRARFHASPHGHGYGIPSRTLHAYPHR